jgi:uncharacterized repeat protein (TIGR01451 family)
MIKTIQTRALFLTAMAGLACSALNAASLPIALGADVQSHITVLKVTSGSKPPGADKAHPATHVDPGDELQYSVLYRNVGKASAQKLVAELPIPKGTTFTGQYTGAATLLASTDGKTFEPYPLKRRVRTPAGLVKEDVVPLSEYRALRWPERNLGSGESWDTAARVRVVSSAAP